MNQISKESLSTLSHEKVVDMLWVYIQKENARLAKQAAYHKQYNLNKAAEREEFKAWKASQKK